MEKALAKRPEQRWQSVSEFENALRPFAPDAGRTSSPESQTQTLYGANPPVRDHSHPNRFALAAIVAALAFLFALAPGVTSAGNALESTAELVAAVRDGAEGALIEVAAGTFELDAPLEPKAGMTIKGAGIDKTIITCAA